MSDPFGKAGAASLAGARPRLHQLGKGLPKKVTRTYAPGTDQEQKISTQGRLVLMIPKSVERNVPGRGKDAKPRDRWTVDTVVLDGPEITEVIDFRTQESVAELEEPLVPASKNALIPGMYISSVTLGAQFDGAREAGVPMLLGRIGRLAAREDQSPAYCLTDYTDEEAEIARKYLAAHHNPFDNSGDEEE